MIDPTGCVEFIVGGKAYACRLTMRGIARLQGKHGRNIAGLLDGSAGDIPDMGAMLDLVSEALQRGSKLEAELADDIADELLSADQTIIGAIIAAAFPESVGNAKT